jgi:hypothetical protein
MQAEGSDGTLVTLPADAPTQLYSYDIGEIVTAFADDFEFDAGWTVESDSLFDGPWQRGIPVGGGDMGDPPFDGDGSGQCWMTGKGDGVDLDGGPTRLTTPVLDTTGLPDPVISYVRWFTNDDGPSDPDRLVVEISADGGGGWTVVEVVDNDQAGWVSVSYRVADFVTPSDELLVRFSATDNPNDSRTEAAIDGFSLSSLTCESDTLPGDVNGDGVVDFSDLLSLLSAWGPCAAPPAECPADFDDSGTVDFTDLLVLLSAWS